MSLFHKNILAGASGAGGAEAGTYVDDVFSCFLYKGTGASHTIANGIDLSGEGGLVWIKQRNATIEHFLFDTERGATKSLSSNDTTSEYTSSTTLTGFGSTGFTLSSSNFVNGTTSAPRNYCSWTFRKAPGFFDVVTWTGDGTDGREIPHSLGSAPGMVIIKRTDSSEHWMVYHRSQTTKYGSLNNNSAFSATGSGFGGFNMQEVFGNSTSVILPDANNITVARFGASNASGGTYVAYIFAHDDQSFGTNSDEAIINCGSFTTNSSSEATVNLGFEPQYFMFKRTDGADDWYILDTMRGFGAYNNDQFLEANTTEADNLSRWGEPTATGWTNVGSTMNFGSSQTYIYMAIRRPHKPPSAATDVFKPFSLSAGEGSDTFISTGFDVDTFIYAKKSNSLFVWGDRLRGISGGGDLLPSSTAVEGTNSGAFFLDHSRGVTVDFTGGHLNSAPASTSKSYVRYFLRRAPGFFDAVAYSGGSSAQNISHNLTVKPEMIITKNRTTADGWGVQHSALGATYRIRLSHEFSASTNSGYWNDTEPTASVFTVGTDKATGQSGSDYIGWLFASLSGISKVGSYSGTGSNIDVDCGFTAGARFVLIKRSDATGDWYAYDSARGIVAGNDPYLLFNEGSTAEVTNTDYIDPLNSGFTVTSSAPAALNASGGTYIFLAIA